RVEGSGKLLKLVVDIGTEERQLVAGIAEYYAPEALIGKNIVVLANLEPKMIRGIPSNGMILAADGGRVSILTVDGDVLPGTPVR
ncbi:MAG: methionine--tRNA ligase, partial [Candidatus Micrarchaeota archaeon]